MSYEGYEQYLCAKGHYWERDAHDHSPVICPSCSNQAVWWNAVDQTNGNDIDKHVVLKEKPQGYVHPCPTCGHAQPYPKTYVFPKKNVGHHELVPVNSY